MISASALPPGLCTDQILTFTLIIRLLIIVNILLCPELIYSATIFTSSLSVHQSIFNFNTLLSTFLSTVCFLFSFTSLFSSFVQANLSISINDKVFNRHTMRENFSSSPINSGEDDNFYFEREECMKFQFLKQYFPPFCSDILSTEWMLLFFCMITLFLSIHLIHFEHGYWYAWFPRHVYWYE